MENKKMNMPYGENMKPMANMPYYEHHGGGYGHHHCGGYGDEGSNCGFLIIVVLFILLIIIGATAFHGRFEEHCEDESSSN